MSKYKKIIEVVESAQNLESLIEGVSENTELITNSEERIMLQQIMAKVRELCRAKTLSKSQRSINSERLAAMGQMAAAISHDLRNPLSGIKVAAEYLMRKLKGQPELIDIIVNIHNEVIFANNIISNILEHARINKPNLEQSSVKKVIEEAVFTISQQGFFKNIKLEKIIAEDLPIVHLDPLQIRQVLSNLLINSAEAMVGGGELTLKAQQEGDFVVISIVDTGVGIEKTHLDKIFEPFFSTKVKGIGLGLAIAKEIIENHGGEIRVESKLGSGTTFMVKLPIAKTP